MNFRSELIKRWVSWSSLSFLALFLGTSSVDVAVDSFWALYLCYFCQQLRKQSLDV